MTSTYCATTGSNRIRDPWKRLFELVARFYELTMWQTHVGSCKFWAQHFQHDQSLAWSSGKGFKENTSHNIPVFHIHLLMWQGERFCLGILSRLRDSVDFGVTFLSQNPIVSSQTWAYLNKNYFSGIFFCLFNILWLNSWYTAKTDCRTQFIHLCEHAESKEHKDHINMSNIT